MPELHREKPRRVRAWLPTRLVSGRWTWLRMIEKTEINVMICGVLWLASYSEHTWKLS